MSWGFFAHVKLHCFAEVAVFFLFLAVLKGLLECFLFLSKSFVWEFGLNLFWIKKNGGCFFLIFGGGILCFGVCNVRWFLDFLFYCFPPLAFLECLLKEICSRMRMTLLIPFAWLSFGGMVFPLNEAVIVIPGLLDLLLGNKGSREKIVFFFVWTVDFLTPFASSDHFAMFGSTGLGHAPFLWCL